MTTLLCVDYIDDSDNIDHIENLKKYTPLTFIITLVNFEFGNLILETSRGLKREYPEAIEQFRDR
jgi:hypothetical protein